MEVYAAMVHRLDQNIGKILHFLQVAGRLESTLIIVTSDNGGSAELVVDKSTGREIGAEHEIGSVGRWASLGSAWAEVSNTPFRYYKNYSHNGGVVAPFIVHWPAGIERKGAIIRTPAHLIDIHPTLLGVARRFKGNTASELSPSLPGRDLSRYFDSNALVSRDGLLFNHWRDGRYVVSDRWKLVSYGRLKNGQMPPWELYDVEEDPVELLDLADERPKIVMELEAAYLAWEDGHIRLLRGIGVEP